MSDGEDVHDVGVELEFTPGAEVELNAEWVAWPDGTPVPATVEGVEGVEGADDSAPNALA